MYKYFLNYRFICYFFWLLVQILKSSFSVIKIICDPKMDMSEEFRWIESNQKDDIATVLYANSITLTPGTVTLDVEDGRLLVHSLKKSWINDLCDGDLSMNNRIRNIRLSS